MEMLGHSTTLFKNIFPDYVSFSTWYRSTPLSAGETDVPSEITFTLIAYEYNGSHTSMSPDGFKEHFAKDLYTYYKEFEATTKAIDDLMALTEDDVALDDTSIVNFADVPEEKRSTDTEKVDYISNQQKSLTKKGKLRIKKELLSNKRTYTVKTFINRFKHLFIKVLSPAYTFVVSEPDEE